MMSNRNSFGNLYRAVYGIPEKIKVDYIDSNGLPESAIVAAFDPPPTVKDKERPKADSSKAVACSGCPSAQTSKGRSQIRYAQRQQEPADRYHFEICVYDPEHFFDGQSFTWIFFVAVSGK